MRKIDTILKLMKPYLNKATYKRLENVLESVLEPTHLDKSNDEVIEQYLEHYSYLGKSKASVVRIRFALNDLAKTMNILDADYHDLKQYFVDYKRKRQVKERTLNTVIAYISGLYSYLFAEEWIAHNPMLRIEKQKAPKEQQGNFTEEELRVLRNGISDIRDRALLEFLLATGCRRSEVANMKISDIDFTNMVAHVHKGKGGKDRTVFFDKIATKYLKKYLFFRSYSDDSPLFANRSETEDAIFYGEKQLKPTTITTIFNKYGKELGISKCHPHKCRHYCLTKLIRSGMRPELVKAQAGHASIQTTIDTYTNVVAVDVEQAYRKAMA